MDVSGLKEGGRTDRVAGHGEARGHSRRGCGGVSAAHELIERGPERTVTTFGPAIQSVCGH